MGLRQPGQPGVERERRGVDPRKGDRRKVDLKGFLPNWDEELEIKGGGRRRAGNERRKEERRGEERRHGGERRGTSTRPHRASDKVYIDKRSQVDLSGLSEGPGSVTARGKRRPEEKILPETIRPASRTPEFSAVLVTAPKPENPKGKTPKASAMQLGPTPTGADKKWPDDEHPREALKKRVVTWWPVRVGARVWHKFKEG